MKEGMIMRTKIEDSLKVSVLAAALAVGSFSCAGDDGAGSGMLTAPAGVKAMILPGPAVHLTWQDTPSEHHYAIERKDAAGELKEFTKEINMTAYHDADVKSGMYTYRVAGALHDGTKGPYSAEVTAVVP